MLNLRVYFQFGPIFKEFNEITILNIFTWIQVERVEYRDFIYFLVVRNRLKTPSEIKSCILIETSVKISKASWILFWYTCGCFTFTWDSFIQSSKAKVFQEAKYFKMQSSSFHFYLVKSVQEACPKHYVPEWKFWLGFC